MNEKQLSRVISHLAEELVPADVDLWPAIRDRFETRHKPSQKRESFMNANLIQHRRWRLAGAFLLSLLVLGVLLLATPQGRAWAQEILRFFSRAESDHLPVQSWQQSPIPVSSTITPDPSSILDADQTVVEVEQSAGFDVLEPTWLPDNLTFVGATLEQEQTIVRLFYRYIETNGLVLREEPFQRTEDCELCGEVGSSAAVEVVKIGDTLGEYVEGTWKLTDNGPVWDSDPYLKTIRWQTNGMAFELLYMGPPDTVTKEDMIAIAKSLE